MSVTNGGQALLLHRPRDAAVLLLRRHDGTEWARWPCQDPAPALLDLPVRRAALVAPSQTAEVWDIPLDPRVEDRYEGLVHDFRMGEGVPVRAWRRPRRSPLPGPLHHPAAEPDGSGVIGWSPGLGALAFGAVVVITMLAAMSFDARLIWDGARENARGRLAE